MKIQAINASRIASRSSPIQKRLEKITHGSYCMRLALEKQLHLELLAAGNNSSFHKGIFQKRRSTSYHGEPNTLGSLFQLLCSVSHGLQISSLPRVSMLRLQQPSK